MGYLLHYFCQLASRNLFMDPWPVDDLPKKKKIPSCFCLVRSKSGLWLQGRSPLEPPSRLSEVRICCPLMLGCKRSRLRRSCTPLRNLEQNKPVIGLPKNQESSRCLGSIESPRKAFDSEIWGCLVSREHRQVGTRLYDTTARRLKWASMFRIPEVGRASWFQDVLNWCPCRRARSWCCNRAETRRVCNAAGARAPLDSKSLVSQSGTTRCDYLARQKMCDV